MPEGEWSLLRSDIFDKLEKERVFFESCITSVAIDMATEYACEVELSAVRLTEVWDFWVGDMKRTRLLGFKQQERNTLEDYSETPVQLDHFKRAAFLAFWLRRLTPIIRIDAISTGIVNEKREQGRYFAFANELLAYSVALQLCGYYEYQRQTAREMPALAMTPASFITGRVRSWAIVRDYVMVLRHKAVSPHAFYLVLRSMFLY